MGFQKLSEKIVKVLERVTSKEYCDKYSQILADQIKKRAQLGYGVDVEGGQQKKFRPLKPSTIASREYAQRIGELSPNTTPRTANVTRTGQLINSITPNGSPGHIGVTLTESRDDGKLNVDIVGYLEEKGFSFLKEAGYEKEILERAIRNDIEELLKTID